MRAEPSYTSVCVAAAGHWSAQVDIEGTLPPPHGPTSLNLSMIHPRCPTDIVAACRICTEVTLFYAMPASIKKYRHLKKPLQSTRGRKANTTNSNDDLSKPNMRYIRTLSTIASGRSLAVALGVASR
jgi:hypothetical protein